MRRNVTVLGLIVTLVLTILSSPVWAMSPKTSQCVTLANAAYEIMKAKEGKTMGLATEKQARDFSRQFGLAPMHVDLLDGLITLIYRDDIKATSGDAALAIYSSCVMR